MGDGDELLKAIVEDPDDVGLRLVYADWLEENGDPERAEFIRVECQLEEMPEDHAQRSTLERRRRVLGQRGGWHGRLNGLLGWCQSRRGLPNTASLHAAEFLTHAEQLLERLPVTDVQLCRLKGLGEQLARCTALTRIRSLKCSDGLDTSGADVEALLGSPYLTSLRTLDISFCELGVAAIKALTRAAFRSGLESLSLSRNSFGVAGVELLTSGPQWERLKRLDLGHLTLGDAGVVVLAASSQFPALGCLRLEFAHATPGGVRALALSRHFPNLTELDLTGNFEVREEGVAVLARSGLLPRLRELRLGSTGFGIGAARAFGRCDAGRLEILSLRDNHLLPASMREFVAAPLIRGLKELELSGCGIGDEGAELLAASPALTGLRSLRLANCKLGPWGVKALACSPNLSGLTSLDLGWNDLPDLCLEPLTAYPHLNRLRSLNLKRNHLTDQGMKLLRGWENLPQLTSLDFSHNPLTDEAVAVIAASPFLRRITSLNLSHCEITSEAACELATSPNAIHLLSLIVQGIDVDMSVVMDLHKRLGIGVGG